jgi:sugar phosphate isomerase/epimerase
MARIPIGLQLFSVRGECSRDLPATLKAVRDIGYQAVEPWGYDGSDLAWMGRPARTLRKMLDDSGLACCGMHVQTEALQGDSLDRTVELNRELGNRFLIIAGDKARMSTEPGVAELAAILNEAAARLQATGMFAGYHAHPFDFVRHGDLTAWDILFGRMGPDVVMQVDVGNCAAGGADPVAILRKYPGRARSVHLKEYGGPPGSVIGSGKAQWGEIFRLCETTQQTEWYVVEEGGREGLGFDVCRRSLESLRRMGK